MFEVDDGRFVSSISVDDIEAKTVYLGEEEERIGFSLADLMNPSKN